VVIPLLRQQLCRGACAGVRQGWPRAPQLRLL